MITEKPDSLIFDMDGTLWDAVETYAASWNSVFRTEGIDRICRREDLEYMMGWERGRVLAELFPESSMEERERIYGLVCDERHKLIPENGGVLYANVADGLEALSKHYKLFIVSNCPEGLIQSFMEWAGIRDLITDEIPHGRNMQPKHHNIRLLIDQYDLRRPVYIGDTQLDGDESRLAGIPFVFVTYGFGDTAEFDISFDDFKSLTDYFLNL